MDLNHIALWLAGIPALSLFWRSARAPHRPLGWMAVTAFVLLSELVGWLAFREYAGYVSAALAFLLITLPLWLHGAAGRAGNRFEFQRARRLFGLAALLHPLDDWPSAPRLYEAFSLAHAGKIGDAEALLRVLARGSGSSATVAEAQRLRLLGRWRELRALAEQSGLAEIGREPTLLALYLRALGELGAIDELAEFMMVHERTLLATGVLEVATLYLFVFGGQVELTRQALTATRQVYTAEAKQFWLAVASKHTRDTEQARRLFGQLRAASDAQIRDRSEEQFHSLSSSEVAAPISARTLYVVRHFARSFGERQQLLPNSRGHRVQRRVTLTLIVVNALVYVAGSYPLLIDTRESFEDRFAFYAPDILAGEWWRAVSYQFVHANAIHLVMNLGGLWVLGPFIERAFGRLRFSLIYLISGLCGSLTYLAIGYFQLDEAKHLVGASGCIMGLLGATAAVMLRAWVRQRAAIARQIFLRLLAVVALQVAFDYSTPEVAGLAHAVGLLGGFLAALLLREGVSAERSVEPLA